MPNSGSSVAAALEGLVGGFLAGSDFRRQRTQDRTAASDAERQREIDEEDRRIQRAKDLADLRDRGVIPGGEPAIEARQPGAVEGGLGPPPGEFVPPPFLPPDRTNPLFPGSPNQGGLDAPSLRTRVGQNIAPQTRASVDVGEGFTLDPSHRSEDQIEDARNVRVGQFLLKPEEEQEQLLRAGDEQLIRDLTDAGVFQSEVAQMNAPAPLTFEEGLDRERRTNEARAEGTASGTALGTPDAGIDQSELFQRTNDLADDFRAEAKSPTEVALQIRGYWAAGDNAIGDQTKIIAYNKLLDPESIVRESEFDRVGEAGGFEAEAQALYNRFAEEGRLPEFILVDLDAEVERLSAIHEANFMEIFEFYGQRADAFGIDPSTVRRNPFQGSGGMFDDLVPGEGR